jgi:drug/metabolite transporter (DMT)-like permease
MNPFAGIALKVVSTAFFTAMATLIKLVSERFPVGEIAFARSFFGLVPVLVWAAWRGQFPGVFLTRNPRGHLRRVTVGTMSMFLGFSALGLLPIADATAIGYATPLFTVALAALLLGEAVHVYRWSAVVIGLVGVLVILTQYAGDGGEAERSFLGAGLQLASAATAAYAAIQISILSRTEPAGTIVVYFSSFAALVALFTFPFGWVTPTPLEALMLIGTGLLGGVGQVLMTQSYRYADASVLAPFDYTSMIWAVLASLLVFSTVPTPIVIAGSAIVIGAGLFVIWRERQLGIIRNRIKQAQPPAPPAA